MQCERAGGESKPAQTGKMDAGEEADAKKKLDKRKKEQIQRIDEFPGVPQSVVVELKEM